MKCALHIAGASLLILLGSCQNHESVSTESIVAKPAPKNLAALEWVTGLHTHFIEGTDIEFRLIEVDGSASVAMNPIYLYLLVTKNSTGGSEQTRMVSLPQVSKVEQVRFFGGEPRLEIDVLLDGLEPDGTVSTDMAARYQVNAKIVDGRLQGEIEVLVIRPKSVRKSGP